MRKSRAERRRKPAEITRLTDSTSVDRQTGAVRSTQRADLSLASEELSAIWSPMHLERLARTYWRFLSRVTLGLVKVRYRADGRAIVLLFSPLRLLSFKAPEYEMNAERGLVRWGIARGLLVARRGRDGGGYLQIEIRRGRAGTETNDEILHVEVEVANFYPAIASGISLWLYNVTQSRIHVIVTSAFLRSLARLDLAESRVGRFADEESAAD
ncbi:MAG TPA: hypothetical protein VGG08_00070 [Solirubrobacteraceae bacterium]